MDITRLVELLPTSVKLEVIDFDDVRLKDGRDAVRVTVGHILTDEEKAEMKSKRFVGLDCVCHCRYAPEIRYSYFYVV